MVSHTVWDKLTGAVAGSVTSSVNKPAVTNNSIPALLIQFKNPIPLIALPWAVIKSAVLSETEQTHVDPYRAKLDVQCTDASPIDKVVPPVNNFLLEPKIPLDKETYKAMHANLKTGSVTIGASLDDKLGGLHVETGLQNTMSRCFAKSGESASGVEFLSVVSNVVSRAREQIAAVENSPFHKGSP